MLFRSMLLAQLDMPSARYAFALLATGEIWQKRVGFISYRIGAERQYIEFERSENISNSSFVNLFHESEYIDRRKNESKSTRICLLLLLLFMLVIMVRSQDDLRATVKLAIRKR